jgi:hypothetical protein
MLSRIRGKEKRSIHVKCTCICCKGVGCSASGMSKDTGFDFQVNSEEQDMPNIAPLSHSAAKIESCGVGKARWSAGRGCVDGGVIGMFTNISSKMNDVCSLWAEASKDHDSECPRRTLCRLAARRVVARAWGLPTPGDQHVYKFVQCNSCDSGLQRIAFPVFKGRRHKFAV